MGLITLIKRATVGRTAHIRSVLANSVTLHPKLNIVNTKSISKFLSES